jgi:hypothetical protein
MRVYFFSTDVQNKIQILKLIPSKGLNLHTFRFNVSYLPSFSNNQYLKGQYTVYIKKMFKKNLSNNFI